MVDACPLRTSEVNSALKLFQELLGMRLCLLALLFVDRRQRLELARRLVVATWSACRRGRRLGAGRVQRPQPVQLLCKVCSCTTMGDRMHPMSAQAGDGEAERESGKRCGG
jgi:hypothetical protein